MRPAGTSRRLASVCTTLALGLCCFAPAAVASPADPSLVDCRGADALGFDVAPGCADGALTRDPADPLVATATFTQAAAHPYAAVTSFSLNTHERLQRGSPWPYEPLRDAFVEVPAGLIANPSAVSDCSLDGLFGTDAIGNPAINCPQTSQVGTAALTLVALCESDSCQSFTITSPLFSMETPAGVPARFAFQIAGTLIVLDPYLRSGRDYGFTVASRDTSAALPIIATKITLWGTPFDARHDGERHCQGEDALTTGCSAEAAPQAFLRLPTSCSGPQLTTLHTDSWFHPGSYNPDGTLDLSDPDWKTQSFLSHDPPGFPLPEDEWGPPVGTTGCDQVPFEPEIAVRPTTDQADSPTGVQVDLSVPQDELTNPAPEAIAQSDLKAAVVRLPEGMAINPASAAGLGACTLAQIDLHHQNTEPTCPDDSKIGSVAIKTPLLEEELKGSVYLAAQNDNPFGSLLALYIVAEARGQVVKLSGEVEPSASGQLVTRFEDQPQLPFEYLHLQLKGGPQGTLINPPTCGTHTATATLAPWSGNAPVDLSSSFTLTEGPGGQPCPGKPLGFDPKLTAGTRSPLAGAFTPFNLRMTREDATQRLTGLSLTPPPGLLASLKGITYCPEATLAQISGAEGTGAAQIADPSCPASSQVGTVTAGAGAGPNPFFTEAGRVYLAGPYKSAPLSLAVVAPAVAGPFDLGNVVVRNALQIDPETAKITAVSDPIPTIIHGIPLDLRDLRVNLDRPNFTLNPTSCDPMSVNATVAGSEGASADLSDHFQVGECGALAFKPELTLRLKGKTKRTGHPALRATLTMPQRGPNADIAKAAVTLPHSEFLAQAHIRTICTRVQYAAGGGGGEQCPKGSVYGHARAFTPLLDQPLEGPVYLRSSNHPLPDLVASLGGQIHIDLVGRIDAPNGGIRNTFEAVPDAPVSKFILTMQGGSRGLLENSTDLCRGAHRATARFDGQNGKISDSRPKVRADCGKGRKHKLK
jgi:hypothetical protein